MNDELLNKLEKIFVENTVAITRYTDKNGVVITDMDTVVVDTPKAIAALRTWCLEVVEASVPEHSKTWTSWIQEANDDIERAAGISIGINKAIDQTLSNARKRLGLE